jgi:hypothetical protein
MTVIGNETEKGGIHYENAGQRVSNGQPRVSNVSHVSQRSAMSAHTEVEVEVEVKKKKSPLRQEANWGCESLK